MWNTFLHCFFSFQIVRLWHFKLQYYGYLGYLFTYLFTFFTSFFCTVTWTLNKVIRSPTTTIFKLLGPCEILSDGQKLYNTNFGTIKIDKKRSESLCQSRYLDRSRSGFRISHAILPFLKVHLCTPHEQWQVCIIPDFFSWISS